MSAYARTPFSAIWEIIRACALACVHRRAAAIPHRDPHALATAEAQALIDAPSVLAGGLDAVDGPTRADVDAALDSVVDPELGMSVVALGLVYDVTIQGDTVRVTMTVTSPGCPLQEVVTDWVRRAVMCVPGIARVEVTLTFDPPWTPDHIRRRGIARIR